MSDHYVIVGLGNPGEKYAETRHNAGFWFLDLLAERSEAVFRIQSKFHAELAKISLYGQDCILVKPMTFMNHSGQAVRAVVDYYKISSDRLLVAYDELDLPPGVARLKQGGGHGGHNGLRDIFRHKRDHEFLRLRIGIGHPGRKDAVTGYVLSRPSAEQELLTRRVVSDAADVMREVLGGEVSKAMKTLHTVTGSDINGF
ncbi:MAG: aminoacyl-tRNA hydrolase [Xanthomonadales bacterium]